MGQEATSQPGKAEEGHDEGALMSDDVLRGYRERWDSLQARFVDEPRQSVEEADRLVADLMGRISKTFTEKRAELEAQWEEGSDASTEDLRLAVRRYRSFFDRLLAA